MALWRMKRTHSFYNKILQCPDNLKIGTEERRQRPNGMKRQIGDVPRISNAIS